MPVMGGLAQQPSPEGRRVAAAKTAWQVNPDLGDVPMRRTVLFLAAVAACALLIPAGASAMTPAKTCTASSPNVIGHTVKGTLTSSNVDPSQARFATCAQAKQ